MKRLFVSDCEGPISKNDNAYEIAENFIPNGGKFFSNISRYDDVLADIVHREAYTAGSTLRLILPFFKAYRLTDHDLEAFSEQNILLIANSRATLQHVQRIADAFIVSTSYEHYIRALCKAVDFPFKNTYCTHLSLDKIPITPQERDQLRVTAQEISQMRQIDIPSGATSLDEFSHCDQTLIQRLDEIFWTEIPKMFVGKFLDVVTVGGEQKAESIRDAARKLGADLSEAIYVGDSITDVEAFRLVKESGGLAVSFNGNGYAVRNADVAVMSESNTVTAVIADLFCRLGRERTLEFLADWSSQTLAQSGVEEALAKQFIKVYTEGLPKVQIVTAQNMEAIVKESSEFRRMVRGVSIGRLG
ncbi:MAG: HAD hydrolase family protein [Candidatus Bathyarchaeota archaeon]|nr:HAD hydrolase family protein [Candidatus Bathyarchaeota archaeon]